MEAITWAPGTDPEFDQLFDILRIQQYNNKSHRLWENYSSDAFKSAVALTICFDDNNLPEMCSSIAYRDCWPANVYRILNRLWKTHDFRKGGAPNGMSPSFGISAKSQIDWLTTNTNYELYFISRQTNNWKEWVIRNFQQVYNIDFKTDDYKYLTCPNECDATCWQKIIYNGNKQLLNQWKHNT